MKPKDLRDKLSVVQPREFTVKTMDGDTFHVPHTDFIIHDKIADQVALFAEGNKMRILDTYQITSIEFEAGKRKRC
jgi:hypothetical protein